MSPNYLVSAAGMTGPSGKKWVSSVCPRITKRATDQITEVVSTSLFIHSFLQETKVLSRIVNSIERLATEKSTENYHREHWNTVNLIVEAAKKHIG